MAYLDETGLAALWQDVKEVAGKLTGESDGYARGGLAEVTAKGHAEQVATTGKNLLPNTATSQTINGVTFTPNADGSVTVDGTATARANFFLNGTTRWSMPDGVYTLSNHYAGTGSVILEVSTANSMFYAVTNSVNTNTFTLSNDVISAYISVYANESVKAIIYPQLELGSVATEYEPYTGGAPSPSPDYPQEIQVVRGRNLLSVNSGSQNAGGFFVPSRTPCVLSAGTYTFSLDIKSYSGSGNISVYFRDTSHAAIAFGTIAVGAGKKAVAVSVPSGCVEVDAYYGNSITAEQIQLTRGSTPQPYVPYGHVGMEARDPDTDELISCTALPLPSRGWVAGLPDGTADSLRLDGAGKCEWTLKDAETTTAVTDGITGTVGVDVMSTTGQIADGATVLYKLTTPVVEHAGYVDMPAIPSECQISIPELDALGIRYFVDSAVTELARQWYARANSEYEDRLQALEEAMATIITGS